MVLLCGIVVVFEVMTEAVEDLVEAVVVELLAEGVKIPIKEVGVVEGLVEALEEFWGGLSWGAIVLCRPRAPNG